MARPISEDPIDPRAFGPQEQGAIMAFDERRNPDEQWVSTMVDFANYFNQNFVNATYLDYVRQNLPNHPEALASAPYLDFLRRMLLQAAEFGYSQVYAGHVDFATGMSGNVGKVLDPLHPLFIMQRSCFLGRINELAYEEKRGAFTLLQEAGVVDERILNAVLVGPSQYNRGVITPSADTLVSRSQNPIFLNTQKREYGLPSYSISYDFNHGVAQIGRDFGMDHFGRILKMDTSTQQDLATRFGQVMPWISFAEVMESYQTPLVIGNLPLPPSTLGGLHVA